MDIFYCCYTLQCFLVKRDSLLKPRRFVIAHQIFCHLFPYFFQGDLGWGLAEQIRAPIVIVTVRYLLWQSIFATK